MSRQQGWRPIEGPRWELAPGEDGFPEALMRIPEPPERLYGIGDARALQEGLAIIGARKATPYGLSCARRFAYVTAKRGIAVISGGARGCDGSAHLGAVEAGGPTVAFLGGGCDRPYPAGNVGLFKRMVACGGAVVSEHGWDVDPKPYMFRRRNRLIAGLAKATLIVEAGLPSGTFSTADEAIAANRDVLVVPGAITSDYSRGSNRLLYQGAIPIVDGETFEDALSSLFDCLRMEVVPKPSPFNEDELPGIGDFIDAICAEPMRMEELYRLAERLAGDGVELYSWVSERLVAAERAGVVTRYPDGSYGPCLT